MSKKLLELRAWFKTNDGIFLSLLFFFPLGFFLLWKYGNNKITTKIIGTISIIGYWLILGFFIFATFVYFTSDQEWEKDYLVLQQENERLEGTEKEFISYQNKMKPYENLPELDAKKREKDAQVADKVSEKLNLLPTVDELELSHKADIDTISIAYEGLSEAQKELVDGTLISELKIEINKLEKAAKKSAEEEKLRKEKEAAEKAKKEAEEAKGYDTGITYEQLARTPDDYMLKKVKFSGKVIQVLEDEDNTQIRLAVNDNYDTIIYIEYESNIVSSRVLEDDYITVSGVSMGLLSYKSTMGGTITIPSVIVSKIER